MIHLKVGVDFNNTHPKLWRAVAACAEVMEREGLDLWITSARDSKHMAGSLHYIGCAVDMRSRELPTEADKIRVLNAFRVVAGIDYDVLYENRGTEGQHFHLEYDPH